MPQALQLGDTLLSTRLYSPLIKPSSILTPRIKFFWKYLAFILLIHKLSIKKLLI